MNNTQKIPQINCDKCNSGKMEKTSIQKFSGCLVTLGFIIIIPSILAIGLAMFLMITALINGSSLAIIDGGTALFIFIISIPTFIVGFILILKKKVWKCNQCGYIYDRA